MMNVLRRPSMVVILACLTVTSARAQLAAGQPPEGGSSGGRSHRGARAQPSAHLPDLPATPDIWPRLDAGALICGLREDLVRSADLDADAPLPMSCRHIPKMVPIDILARASPGATQVQLKDGNAIGWTDAWLPPGEKPAAQRRPNGAPGG